MMRSLLLLSLGLTLLGGCGPAAPKCGPANCTTCCDANDTCAPFATTLQCGAGGNVCASCSPTQTCSFGICSGFSGSGGPGDLVPLAELVNAP